MAQIKTYLTKDGLVSIDAGEAYFSTLGRARSIQPEKERKEIIAKLLNAVRKLIINLFGNLEQVRQEAVRQLQHIEETTSILTHVSEHATSLKRSYKFFLEKMAAKNYDEDENEISNDMHKLKLSSLEINAEIEVYKDIDKELTQSLEAFHRMLTRLREMETLLELQLKSLDNALEKS